MSYQSRKKGKGENGYELIRQDIQMRSLAWAKHSFGTRVYVNAHKDMETKEEAVDKHTTAVCLWTEQR